MPPPVLYHNNVAAVLWLFMGLWVCGVLVMSYLLWRDGPPAGESTWFVSAVLATFWGFAIIAVRFVASRPCTRVRIGANGRISILQRYPHRAVHGEFSPTQIGSAVLVETTDSDGDPYFICQLAIGHPFNEPIRIAEGGREHCARIQAEFDAKVAASAVGAIGSST